MIPAAQPGPNDGGGLLNQGSDNQLFNVTITQNRAAQSGNGFYNSGQLWVFQSTVSSNNGPAGTFVAGGGGYNTRVLRFFNSTVTDNVLTGLNRFGGGIVNSNGDVAFYNTTISANTASSGSGIGSTGGRVTIWDSTVANNPGSTGLNLFSNTEILASTISDNGSGQMVGISVGGNVQINMRNSTITGHSAYGIYVTPSSSASANILNSTIASNGGNGINRAAGTVRVRNTIIANNAGGDCSSGITTNGYNITSDASCFFPAQASDQTLTNPLLGALANNGGPTQTMALQAGSPAIDQGYLTWCTTTGQGGLGNVDQRGAIRPFDDPASPGTSCDIGAVEFGAASDDYPDTYVYSTSVTEDNTLNAVVPYTDPDGSPLGGGIVLGNGPLHEQFANLDMAGNLTYTPLPDFNGYDAFVVQVVQQDLPPPILARYREVYMLALIRVDAQNDPPVNTTPATATVTVSTPTGIGGVSVTDPDINENPGGQMQITLTSTNGTASVPGTSSATVNNNGTANVTITGTLAQVNTELAGIQFTGAAVGAATLQVLSSDLGNWGAPGALTDTDLINITVDAAPVVVVGGSGSGGGSGGPTCLLTIDVEADKEVVNVGDPVWWTIEVRNTGPVDCHGLTVTGTMPAEFITRDITTSQGTITRDDPRFEVNLGTLTVDQAAEIDIDSLLGSGAGLKLPEGAAGQQAGEQLCLTGYLNTTHHDTDCVTLFPDSLPSTGGQPVKAHGLWIVAGLIGLLMAGGWWLIGRKHHSALC